MAVNDGTDLAQDKLVPYQLVNNIKNSWAGVAAPATPQAGMRWLDTSGATKVLKAYNGTGWDSLYVGQAIPPGTITAWLGGYFTDGSNGGYTYQLGSANTVAGANSYVNDYDWSVCDGTVPNDSESPIFSAADRYLPNLTGDRFIEGDTSAGSTGGANTMAHTHDLDIASFDSSTWTTMQGEAHTGPGSDDLSHINHTHSVDPPNTQSAAASNTENRPLFLGVFFMIKVK